MGATFIAYKKDRLQDCDMGYGHVQRYRCFLLGLGDVLVENDKEKSWQAIYEKSLIKQVPYEDVEKMFDKLRNYAMYDDPRKASILWGIYSFCNHSDCDGDFGEEECGDIARAMQGLLNSGLLTIPDDIRNVEAMMKVFKAGSEDCCVVEIL